MVAKTWTPKQDEMKSRIARFKELVSTKARYAEGKLENLGGQFTLDANAPPERHT